MLRNRNERPRAWVVHAARWLNPTAEMSLTARNRAMREMIYADDPFWHDPTMRAFDPSLFAWVDRDHQTESAPYLSGSPSRATETVKVSYPTPSARRARGLAGVSRAGHPGRCVLPRLGVDDRRQAGADLSGQPVDARDSRPVRDSSPGLFLLRLDRSRSAQSSRSSGWSPWACSAWPVSCGPSILWWVFQDRCRREIVSLGIDAPSDTIPPHRLMRRPHGSGVVRHR